MTYIDLLALPTTLRDPFGNGREPRVVTSIPQQGPGHQDTPFARMEDGNNFHSVREDSGSMEVGEVGKETTEGNMNTQSTSPPLLGALKYNHVPMATIDLWDFNQNNGYKPDLARYPINNNVLHFPPPPTPPPLPASPASRTRKRKRLDLSLMDLSLENIQHKTDLKIQSIVHEYSARLRSAGRPRNVIEEPNNKVRKGDSDST